jgi:hypothetical protein
LRNSVEKTWISAGLGLPISTTGGSFFMGLQKAKRYGG